MRDDERLLEQLRQRLVAEGFPAERAAALAGALLGSGPRLTETLGEVEAASRCTDPTRP